MDKATSFCGFKCSPAEKKLFQDTWPGRGEFSRITRQLLNQAADKIIQSQKPAYLSRPIAGNEYATE